MSLFANAQVAILRRPRAGLSSTAKAAAKASALGEPFPGKEKKENGFDEDMTSPVQEKAPRKFQNKTDQQLVRAFNWVKTFEDKILQLLEPEYVDLKKLGGKPVEEALDEELAQVCQARRRIQVSLQGP